MFPGDAIFMNVDEQADSRVFLFKFKNRWPRPSCVTMHRSPLQSDGPLALLLDAGDGRREGRGAVQASQRAHERRESCTLACEHGRVCSHLLQAAGGRGGSGAPHMGVEALQQMLGLPPGDTAQLFQSTLPAQLQQLLGSQISGLGMSPRTEEFRAL